MFLSRIELRRDLEEHPELLASVGQAYGVHQLVWTLMSRSPGQKRDFLYRQEGAGREMRLYVLSTHEPRDEQGLWSVKTKPYAPGLEVGQSYRFLLRANSTVARSRGVDRKQRSLRHDVVMDLKFRMKASGETLPPVTELVQKAGEDWLLARASRHGFSLRPGTVFVDGYRQEKVAAVKGTRNRTIEFSAFDFEGGLTVTEPDLFRAALLGGLGRARAFGCGLMMIQPG